MLRRPSYLSLAFLTIGTFVVPFAHAEHRLVRIGDRRISIDCDGRPSSFGTVVLMTGQGRTARDWARVQPAVSHFARVCSYDRSGLGESDPVSKPQSVDEIIEDLHALLQAAGEKAPYLLVGHSIAGIYCRRFATRYPGDVQSFVFVDSSHEEQIWRLHEVDPEAPPPNQALASVFFTEPGQRLNWNTKLALIVIGRGKTGPPIPQLTEKQNAAFPRIWRELQEDLAKRSPKGQFRVAEESGHYIQIDQPELVIQAIRDLIPTQ
ncbi:MAG TPA: alpha/beta hydrolase [Bryobacteraceae bacterium]|nr:alpha/beta hydrolase [Bryobacteraceae bacterium]